MSREREEDFRIDLAPIEDEDPKDRKKRLSREWCRRRLEQIRRAASHLRLEVTLRDRVEPYGYTVARVSRAGEPWPAVDWWLTTGTVREVVPRGVAGAKRGYAAWLLDVARFLAKLEPRPREVIAQEPADG